MATHTVTEQQRFLIQWFRTWSELQKEDFSQIVVHKLNPSHCINGILANGIQNLNSDNTETSGRPPSLFTCQIKLFNDWWDSWKQEEKDAFTASLKDSDPKFWNDVEEELAGTGNRKKRDEEFFAMINNANGEDCKEVKNDEVAAPANVIDTQLVSHITTTTAVKVDLAVHNIGNGSAASVELADTDKKEVSEETNGFKTQEPQRVPVGTGDGGGVLVIEEDNDEII